MVMIRFPVRMCPYYPRQVVHIHVPLSSGSVIWYWPRAVLLSSWEGEGTGCLPLCLWLWLPAGWQPWTRISSRAQKFILIIEVPLPFTYDNQKYWRNMIYVNFSITEDAAAATGYYTNATTQQLSHPAPIFLATAFHGYYNSTVIIG